MDKELLPDTDFRRIFDVLPQPVIIIDPETFTLLCANKAAAELYGYTVEELKSLTLKDLHAGEDYLYFSQVKRSDTRELEHKTIHKTKSGQNLDVAEESSVIFFEGKSARLITVTKLNAADFSDYSILTNGYNLYESIIENSEDAILSKDLDGIITSWNKGAQNLYGYTPDEVIGQHVSILAPDEKKNEIDNIMEVLRSGGKIEHYETTRQKKNGRKVIVSVTISPIIDSKGNIAGASAIARNITDKKLLEAQLKEKEGQLKIIADNINEIFYLAKPQTNQVLYASTAFEKIWGVSLEKLYQNHITFSDSILPEHQDRVKEHLNKQIEGLESEVEYKIKRPDGSVRWILDRAYPIADDGSERKTAGIAEDITERKMYEDELREALIREKSAHMDAEDGRKRISYLAEASVILNSSLNYKETLTSIAELITPALADWCAVDILEDDELKRISVTHVDPAKVARVYEIQEKYPPKPDSPGGVFEVIETGKPVIYPIIPDQLLKESAENEEHYQMIKELGLKSAMIVPLISRKQVFGTISMVTAESGRVYTEFDLKFAESLALRAGLAIDNALLYNESLQLNERLEQRVKERTLQLLETNQELERQIIEKQKAEKELQLAHDELEARVAGRTAELKQSNEQLEKESAERMRRAGELEAIIESMPDAVFIGDSRGIKKVNSVALKILGYNSFEDMIKDPAYYPKILQLRFADTGEEMKQEDMAFAAALRGETVARDEILCNMLTGEDLYIRTAAAPIKKGGETIGAVAVITDISDRKKAENERIKVQTALQASLREKEILLKEIHHRVKNNLQVISSLLNLQSNYIEDLKTKEIFLESQNRIRSMALIHEKLYQMKDFSNINFNEYVHDLTSSLFETYRVAEGRISLNINIEDVYLNIDTAIVIGLMINELVSNSLKYAFPPDKFKSGNAQISITLLADNDKLLLRISDNGVGFPPDIDFMQTDTLGLQLVSTFLDQLNAEIKLNTVNGTEFLFIIPAPVKNGG